MKDEDKTGELRAATREANETLKDFRRALKDGEALLVRMAEVKDDLIKVSEAVFDERMSEQVAEGLTRYSTELDTALEEAQQGMYDRVDTLARVLLGRATPEDQTLIEVMISKVKDDKPIITMPSA